MREEDRPAVEQFAANLRAAREDSGLTQEQLAASAGLHRTHVGLLERAEREPRLSTIAALSGALGVPGATLLRDIS